LSPNITYTVYMQDQTETRGAWETMLLVNKPPDVLHPFWSAALPGEVIPFP
jgi:hypothetical protein